MFASKDLFFSKPSGYQISRSLRFRQSATAYLNRTYATPTSTTIGTISFWYKRGLVGNSDLVTAFGTVSTTTGNGPYLQFTTNGALRFVDQSSDVITSAFYRDPAAWYHFVLAIDTTQATAANRLKFYVNGVQITSFSSATYGAQNYASNILAAGTQYIGYSQPSNARGSDGYMAEVNFIDGQALTPLSFGQTNTVTGVWQPLKYTGTYGTNGFYLNFSDNSNNTATTIGKDYSGNGNNWTPNNISVTAGVTYDSMLDVPTLFADGGNGRGNYAVLNAVSGYSGLPLTAANIQTSAVPSGANWFSRSTTMGISSGKWYAEFSMPSITSGNQGNPAGFGIIPASNDFSAAGQLVGDANRGYAFYCPDTAANAPVKRVAGSNTSVGSGSATTTSDIFMVAFDLTSGNAWFGKNGTWYAGDPSAGTGASITGITAAEYVFAVSIYRDNTFTNNTVALNFGQRPFAYTPPTGFVALNTQNLPTPTISNGANYMAATTYTGTGSALTIANTVNGISFQPDFVWVKGRSGATDHALYDSVRGTTKDLVSNSTAAETTQATGLTAFGSTGFTVGALAKMNTNAATYVGWQWLAGTTSSSNTNGSITSTVSVGATQGFSVVTYTGTGANATVGHGLGVTPKMMIFKVRSTTNDWTVYHSSLPTPATQALFLNLTNAVATSTTVWNSTNPTSSVFSIGNSTPVNTNGGTFVAYCFSEVAGYSKFGSYTGNGSTDGPFVFCGFRPRWIMIKKTSAAGDSWYLKDTSRSPYNVGLESLLADTSGAEGAGESWDALSNGIKLRTTSSGVNTSGATYIYAAFAENPFKNSLAR